MAELRGRGDAHRGSGNEWVGDLSAGAVRGGLTGMLD